MKSTVKPLRLPYLDWTRGLAAVVMLQGHAFHSFTKPELRNDGAYVFSQFLGGMPPAIFLFLTGVTLAFLMHGQERRGLPGASRILAVLRRAGFLLGVAVAFRLQLWLFGLPNSPWTDLLKVDILNCMGLTVALLAPMVLFRTAERVHLCAVLGLAIALASPLVSQANWAGVPNLVKAYLNPSYDAFSIFPWAAFLAFGVSAGSLLRLTAADDVERLMQWSALVGLGLVTGGRYFADLPYSLYPRSEFWLNSPMQILVKLGVLLIILPVAYLWTRSAGEGWNWLRQFGTTSLLVYWVHIELVYGRWVYPFKENLTVSQAAVAAIGLVGLMLVISAARTHGRGWWNTLTSFRWTPEPDRVSGD